MAAWIICSALLAVLAWFPAGRAWRDWRRERVGRRPFPAAWRHILRRRMPYFATLPPDLQQQLKRLIQVFLAEKPIIGCAGLVVDDEVRVLVAAHASLLQLNRRAGGWPNLRQVLVYPGPYVAERPINADGTLPAGREVRAGESWQQGLVLLSWDDVLAGAADPHDGRNVAIHEFAHQLDSERGHANGAPFLGRRERYARWAAVLGAAHARLLAQLRDGEPTFIDPYASFNAAEFFAVVSEVFFEQPRELAALEPLLYQELADCYRVDPRSW